MSVPLEPPAPTTEHLLSIRYVATSRCIIPTSDPNLWGLFVGASAPREFLGLLTTEELLASFREDWTAAVVLHNKRTTPSQVSADELKDILDDIDLGF